jgi:hypothetical protein
MEYDSIIRRTTDHHASLLDAAARDHLAASAAAGQPGRRRRGPGFQLGAALVKIGRRLQGIAPERAEPAPLPGVATGTSEGR